MRTGKIARLPNAIREQLNCRLKNGEQGKSILKWVNSLPEVKAILDADFDGHPVSPSNLTEWKDGGYRDWQVRQDALALVTDLQDENALGDKALTSAFNDKLAQWVSIHYAATAQALVASQLDPETKWSRLRQLCADVSRLRRGDVHAERLKLDRERLALEQSKAEELREEDFQAWLQRPEIQAKYFPKQKRGLSRETLALVDNYLMEGISPLDPEEAKKLYPFGQFATQPPIGFEIDQPLQSPPNDCSSRRDETRNSEEQHEDNERSAARPAAQQHRLQPAVPDDCPGPGDEALTSPPLDCSRRREEADLRASSPQRPPEAQPVDTPPANPPMHEPANPVSNPALPSGSVPDVDTDPAIQQSNNPSASEPCPKCHREQLPLTPEGKRPNHACWFCYGPLYDPGTEFCSGCLEALPALAPNGERPYPDCRLCGFRLSPPQASNPASESIAA